MMSNEFRFLSLGILKDNRFTKGLDFYRNQLEKHKGNVLELGMHQLFLSEMLQTEGRKVEGKVYVEEREPSLPKKSLEENSSQKGKGFNRFNHYDTIVIPFNEILALPERKAVIKVLTFLFQRLKNGGYVYLDLLLQEEYVPHKKNTFVDKQDAELTIFESEIIKINYIDQQVTYLLSYEKWQEEKVKIRERKLQPFVWFGVKEFKLILERVGFKEVKIIGEYDEKSTAYENHKVFTYVAQKME